jgi:hypothetical protein
MFQRLLSLTAIVGILFCPDPTLAQPAAGNLPVRTKNPVLEASLKRISSGSALWRDAVTALGATSRHAVILTPDQVVVTDAGGPARRAFDPSVLASAAPVPGQDGKVGVVVVVINLALLQDTHRRRHSLPWEFDADLDRILIHEVYGHAMPYLLAGDLTGKCADPEADERPADACSIKRENAVRAELGLGRRKDSGLDGLALMRPAAR